MKAQLREIVNKEGLLKNEPAMLITEGGATEHGRLMLTSKRLIFAKNLIKTSGFHDYEIRDQRLEPIVDIDLDLINFIHQETYLVDENILSLTYMQYETVKFSVIQYSEWETAIQSARLNPDIPGDPNRRQEAA